MKKLSLKLDELAVESYETDAAQGERGTVEAASLPTLPLCTRYGCVTGYCTEYVCVAEA